MGALGSGSPIACRPLARIITWSGRHFIMTIKRHVEAWVDPEASGVKLEVIGGVRAPEPAIPVCSPLTQPSLLPQDTDSVFFRCIGATLKRAEAIGKYIASEVTKELRKPSGGKPYIELAYEKTMMPSLFMGKKV